ncbi:AMP-binding protein [Novosphingobium pentaromativorans]|uniref:Putative fatty acid CoA ligase n=1 Tax=Novosphingobium pentaromativorans US6-1 TaxID=1088721 RepID=G6EAU6_9SPHN|nr:AMP-binding protein [Novosphingobium pentaromativorans]AIT80566.1 hypothetical protein JI59_12695 [Novosphingobium pentaromativorans US6-1]EHJ61733.1 Putative fatty acid CoA ligase [Novosphingobium pentaromativorans US6-1]
MNRLDLSDPADRNLPRILQLQAETNGDGIYLAQEDRRVSFAQADEMVNRIANGLASQGVARGDRVAFFVASDIEVVYLTLAVNRLGAVWIPVNGEYKGDWLAQTLADSDPKVIVTDGKLIARLAEIKDRVACRTIYVMGDDSGAWPAWARPFDELKQAKADAFDHGAIHYGDVNAVLWTSGTTGKSKGVMQSHNIWIRSAELGGRSSYRTRPGDVHYNVLPLYNTAAWTTAFFRCLVEGIACATDPSFSVTSFWDRVRFYGATHIFTLGAMHMYLWKAERRADDADNPARDAAMTPMPKDLLLPFCERFGLERVGQGFGQSEASAVLSLPHELAVTMPPGALGRPNPDLDLRLIDDSGQDVATGQTGEFAIRPKAEHMMFEGYFANPEATKAAFTEDGWYRMGDLGRQDEDGNYFFVDRKKDAVRLAGRNISTMEVESVIRRHPGVTDVAVFGIPSDELESESELAAHIIPDAGADVTPEDIARYINENAPYFFVPRYIEIVADFPRTPTNKVQKFKLRERGVTQNTWDRKKAAFALSRN